MAAKPFEKSSKLENTSRIPSKLKDLTKNLQCFGGYKPHLPYTKMPKKQPGNIHCQKEGYGISNNIVTSSATDKKLEIDKKYWKINSTFTKISKLILRFTEITKLNSKFTKISKLNSKCIVILNSKINSKFSSFLSMVDEVNISLENSPESHKFCGLGIHIEHQITPNREKAN